MKPTPIKMNKEKRRQPFLPEKGRVSVLGANNNHSVHKTIFVDTLIIGSGPAALGFMINSLKSGRLNDLIRSKD